MWRRSILQGVRRWASQTESAFPKSSASSGWGFSAQASGPGAKRTYARYLQFPSRPRSSDWDPDKVLYGILAVNVGGWMLWQSNPKFMMCVYWGAWVAGTDCLFV